MILRIICGSILIFLCAQSVQATTIAEVIAGITSESYQQVHTNLFVSDGQNRGFTGDLDANIPRVPAYQHDEARDYIFDSFESFGLDPWLDPFWFTRSYGGVSYTYTNCNNVVAVQYGVATNAGWYIVGAHYDSVDTGQFLELSPGADDNASGTAAVLELARILSPHTFRDHIVYIAFDAEEKGLHGAWHFVDTHTTTDPAKTNLILRSDVRGMISLDMLAYNPAGTHQDKVRIYGGSSSTNAPVRAALQSALTRYTSITVVNSGAISASDHYPFHLHGMDACLLIEYTLNPHYHRTTDSIDTPGCIDHEYAAELTRGTAAYLAEQAGIILPATLTPPSFQGEDEVLFSWSAQSGAVYRVAYKDDLTDTNGWQTLGVITNFYGWETLRITNQVGTVSRRFYRVENVYEP